MPFELDPAVVVHRHEELDALTVGQPEFLDRNTELDDGADGDHCEGLGTLDPSRFGTLTHRKASADPSTGLADQEPQPGWADEGDRQLPPGAHQVDGAPREIHPDVQPLGVESEMD